MRNKVQLIGNVGANPEIKTFDSGKKLASLALATSETYTDKATNEKKQETQWHNLVVWGNLAEIFEKYVKKGDRIFVEGKIKYETYEKEGNKMYATKIQVNELLMLSNKTESNSKSGPTDNVSTSTNQDKDDLPF